MIRIGSSAGAWKRRILRRPCSMRSGLLPALRNRKRRLRTKRRPSRKSSGGFWLDLRGFSAGRAESFWWVARWTCDGLSRRVPLNRDFSLLKSSGTDAQKTEPSLFAPTYQGEILRPAKNNCAGLRMTILVGSSHSFVIRAAATFGRNPIDDLIRVGDVAGLAVNAIRGVDF